MADLEAQVLGTKTLAISRFGNDDEFPMVWGLFSDIDAERPYFR